MNKKSAFSLIELSVVLIVIGLLAVGIMKSSVVLQAAKLYGARSMTKSAVVNDISGITLWLEATSVDSFDSANIDDGDSVDNWNDIKSSSIGNYIATESTNPPSYNPIILDDLPGVVFDGTDDSLEIANFDANAYITLFVVGKFNSSDFLVEHGTNATSNGGFLFDGSGVPTTVRRSSNSVANSSSTSWFGSSLALGVMRYDGSNISYKSNDASFTNASTSTVSNIFLDSTLYIGARAGSSLFTDGAFGEIIMFDRALSDDEVDDIVEYLIKKWDIES